MLEMHTAMPGNELQLPRGSGGTEASEKQNAGEGVRVRSRFRGVTASPQRNLCATGWFP